MLIRHSLSTFYRLLFTRVRSSLKIGFRMLLFTKGTSSISVSFSQQLDLEPRWKIMTFNADFRVRHLISIFSVHFFLVVCVQAQLKAILRFFISHFLFSFFCLFVQSHYFSFLFNTVSNSKEFIFFLPYRASSSEE